MESNKKVRSHFKRSNSKITLILWNPKKNPNKRKKIAFFKNVKKPDFEYVFILEGYV